MHIHILGICGTFMGGIAVLAKQAGHQVSGSDANVYPPMSTQLLAQGIVLHEGYKPEHLEPAPDCVVIGNALSRGNPAVEYVLNQRIPYLSGPEWLSRYILPSRWVLAVAGTHGKTTTSSMLAWILETAGLNPGFLIGGIPQNFELSARLGELPYFVVEADEYDTAFFDKRSKFVHYQAKTAILNNLEFDHADIFANIDAIKTQFHHLVRTIPGNGLIVANRHDKNITDVLAMGCWSACEYFAEPGAWQAKVIAHDTFEVHHNQVPQAIVTWNLTGEHNINNALAAIVAASHVGVTVVQACAALCQFQGVKRRMELRATINNIKIYDDFAHHPTAIATTLKGLRSKINNQRLIAILEPRSNTMQMGVHESHLAASLMQADEVLLYQPKTIKWSLSPITQQLGPHAKVFQDTQRLLDHLKQITQAGDHIVIMSNGSFDNLHPRLIAQLEAQYAVSREP